MAGAPEEERAAALRAVGYRLDEAGRVVLTTHLNADGDGAGSEAAVAAWLEARGKQVTILNPTPFPPNLRFLLHRPDLAPDAPEAEAARIFAAADLVLVLDTGEPKRVGNLAALMDLERTTVIDHHPPGAEMLGTGGVRDPAAAATGELVYDLFNVCGTAEPWPESSVAGLYVAIVTDTGSFRFANTTPRVHRITAELIGRGVDVEDIYRRVYGGVPLRRLTLVREALDTLQTDGKGLSWLVVREEAIRRNAATPEDFDGLVDYPRSIQGTEVALMFRETPSGGTKVSFRSNGAVDVNRLARRFGGGGHVKAAGATSSRPVDQVIPEVLSASRASVAAAAQASAASSSK